MLAFPCKSLRSSALHRGPPGFFDPASCLVLEASFGFEVLGQGRERSVASGASSALRARRGQVEPSLLGCPPRNASGASSALRASGFAPVPRPQVSLHGLLRNPGRKPGRRNRGPSGAPRSGAKRRGKRACPSTGVSGRTLAPHAARGRERPAAMPTGRTSELRSGLRFVSTAGNRLRRMRGRRGRGVPSFLVTSFWALRKK